MQRVFAKPHLIERARKLRIGSTGVEKRLWQRLRASQLGVRFRRQHPVDGYVLDFACDVLKIGIELDGGQHNFPAHQARDVARSVKLATSGWRILRFWNNEVIDNIEGVIEEIQRALTQNSQSEF